MNSKKYTIAIQEITTTQFDNTNSPSMCCCSLCYAEFVPAILCVVLFSWIAVGSKKMFFNSEVKITNTGDYIREII